MRHRLLIAPALVALIGGCEDAPKSKAPRIQARETLKKTTQRIFPLDEELKKGGVVSDLKLDGYDPISGPGKVYVTTTGKLGIYAVTQALELYNASNGKYPATFREFMDEIIKPGQPDGIQLPERPYYQEYAYDAANHKLVVVEYPERKKRMQKQMDEDLGRS